LKKYQSEDSHREIGYDLVIEEIPEGSRVLDLGCGDGVLLERLKDIKNVAGAGVEISEQGVGMCVEKGLYCYQGDIDEGLSDYRANSFDYVILNQTLQNTKRPDYVLREILRICRSCIISFPNFGYYATRLHLLFRGKMPVSPLLPYEWYETPNIHLLTIRDFRSLCNASGYPVRRESNFSISRNGRSHVILRNPNLYAQYGFFVLDGEGFTGD